MTANYPTDAGIEGRKPDKGIASNLGYKTSGFVSQVGYAKSKLASRRKFENFNLVYTHITGTQKDLIQDFYDARFGDHESFIFDMSHINESGLITVKFRKNSLRITRVAQKATEAESIYTVGFSLEQEYR